MYVTCVVSVYVYMQVYVYVVNDIGQPNVMFGFIESVDFKVNFALLKFK